MTRNLRRPETPFLMALLLLLVVAAVAGISWAGWLAGPENFYGDLWHRLAGVRYQPQHVVIVALDEPTLQRYSEPLVCLTPHFARVIQVLRRVGATIIGLDYLFHVSIESWLQTLDLPQTTGVCITMSLLKGSWLPARLSWPPIGPVTSSTKAE
jgi:CHASE2 domain-containing sensor protein